TSGVVLQLRGPNTLVTLSALSKKQTATSHSSTEAEVLAADIAVRSIGIPALQLWETLLQRPLTIQFNEDNQATQRILETGKNPTLRHLNRTQGVLHVSQQK